MAGGTGELPNIDDYLEVKPRQCAFVKRTTPEQREVIKAKVEAGTIRWRGFQRWLAAQDVIITDSAIGMHFRDHDDDV